MLGGGLFAVLDGERAGVRLARGDVEREGVAALRVDGIGEVDGRGELEGRGEVDGPGDVDGPGELDGRRVADAGGLSLVDVVVPGAMVIGSPACALPEPCWFNSTIAAAAASTQTRPTSPTSPHTRTSLALSPASSSAAKSSIRLPAPASAAARLVSASDMPHPAQTTSSSAIRPQRGHVVMHSLPTAGPASGLGTYLCTSRCPGRGVVRDAAVRLRASVETISAAR